MTSNGNVRYHQFLKIALCVVVFFEVEVGEGEVVVFSVLLVEMDGVGVGFCFRGSLWYR